MSLWGIDSSDGGRAAPPDTANYSRKVKKGRSEPPLQLTCVNAAISASHAIRVSLISLQSLVCARNSLKHHCEHSPLAGAGARAATRRLAVHIGYWPIGYEPHYWYCIEL